MEINKSLLCAIGTLGFLLSVISCASLSSPSSSVVSSSPIVVKKINSVNNLSSSPSPVSSSSSPSSSLVDDQPVAVVDGSFNSLHSDSLIGRPSNIISSRGESTLNSKPSDPLGDYPPNRSPFSGPNFGKFREIGNRGSPSSLTSSFSSSFSPSKLFPSLFSSSTSSSRISSPSSSSHSFAFRPINRLLELFPRNDYSSDDSHDNFPPKVYHHKRPQPPDSQHGNGDKMHHDQQQHGNSLSSPVFYANDLYPDLTKQGSISRVPWFTNTFRGPFQPTRRSTFRSIVDRLFG